MSSPIAVATVSGLLVVRQSLRNARGLAWLHSLLDKAKWTGTPKGEAPADPAQIEIVSPAETADVSYADLSTIEPTVFAQLLSSAAFHLPEDSEMLRCLRIGPILQPLHFHTARARRINAILLLGHGGAATELIHCNSGIYSSNLTLGTGDLVIRRGKAASDWQMLISPSAPFVSAPAAPAPVSAQRQQRPAAAHAPPRGGPRPYRHLLLFNCAGEWPDEVRAQEERMIRDSMAAGGDTVL
jgi:hypothetical protein